MGAVVFLGAYVSRGREVVGPRSMYRYTVSKQSGLYRASVVGGCEVVGRVNVPVHYEQTVRMIPGRSGWGVRWYTMLKQSGGLRIYDRCGE